jgi:two-component system response regulator FixJ
MAREAIVHVVDDDLAVRQSLAFLLATAGLSVRVHDSAASILAQLDGAQAGCIVTDVRMPGMDGIELLRRLRARGASLPVIVMTGHADVPLAVQAMKEGAVDFVEKPFDDERLLGAIRAALERKPAGRHHDQDTSDRLASLSERERQVLDGVLAGKANKVIAFDLGISARTVEVYRANVMSKMGVESVAELVRKALGA